MGLRRRLAGLRIDITPLRTSRDFRLLFAAGTVFYIGGMVSYVAVPYQIYQLTGSNFAVGALSLVELVPLIVFGLYGGALADHVDRRRMLVLCGIAQVVLTAACSRTRCWPTRACGRSTPSGSSSSIAQSLQRPSREALIPRTVRHDESRRRSRGLVARHAGGHPARPGARRHPGRHGRGVLGLRRRRRRAGDRDAAVPRLRSYPPTDMSTPPSIAGIVSASAMPSGAATCSAPMSSTWWRCSWRCRSCCFPPSPRPC